MIEVIVVLVVFYMLDKKRLCPQRYKTMSHVSLSKKKDILDTWARNIQKITTIHFNGSTIYYNIHANNIYTDKVDFITICTEHKSTNLFEIKPNNIIDKILIKLNFHKEIKIQNSILSDFVIIISKDEKLSQNLFDKELQEKLISFLKKEKTFSFKSLKLTNCGEEFCLKFKLNKDLKKKDIDIDKILNNYGGEFLSLFEKLKA